MDGLPPDPYKLLGVGKDADTAAIRSAHRKLVLKCHPDKVIGDDALKAKRTEEFHLIQRAYELLNNEEERTKYDAKARLAALRRELGKDGGARPDPFLYEVRTAEPRHPESQRSSTTYTRANVYTSTPPRSFEDVSYEPESRGVPRKSSSYESDRKRASVREETRERERREREWRYEDEDKLRRQAERRADKDLRGDKKKSRDKDRRRGVEEKTRTRSVYVEDTSDEDYKESRYESSRRRRSEEEIQARVEAARQEGIQQGREHAARERDSRQRDRERVSIKAADLDPKWAQHDNYASQYIKASQRRGEPAHMEHVAMPTMRRAETFAAPSQRYKVTHTVPNAGYSDDEDAPRRSSGRREVRRASEAQVPRQESLSREKSSKSSRRPEPYIVDAPSPPPLSSRKPTLQTHTSAPPTTSSFSRKEPTRSKTQDYPRADKTPPLPRAATFAGERGRGGHSKLRQEVNSTDSDSDAPRYSPRRPQTPPRRSEPTRYNIVNGRTVPITAHRVDLRDSYERDRSESPRGSSHPDRPSMPRQSTERPRAAAAAPARSPSYYPPSATPIIVDAPLPSRPKIVRENSRSNVHTSPRSSSSSGGVSFHNVNYGPEYRNENVTYSSYPPPTSESYSKRGGEGYSSHHHSGSREYSAPYNTARGGRQTAYT